LPYIDQWIDRRREIAETYKKNLSGTALDLPKEAPGNRHGYYIYVVAHPERDKIMQELVENDIHLNISYPWPIHIMEGYQCVGWKEGDLPVTEKRAKTIFSLPMYPTLSDEKISITIEVLMKLLKKYNG